jgi:iron complex outermembrane receptor protein
MLYSRLTICTLTTIRALFLCARGAALRGVNLALSTLDERGEARNGNGDAVRRQGRMFSPALPRKDPNNEALQTRTGVRLFYLVRPLQAALLTILAVTATAADLTREISFNIQRQPLAQALAEFSRQSDVIIVAASELTAGKVCNPISATTTAAKALTQLLDGTKLIYIQDKDGSIVIKQPGNISRRSDDPPGDPPSVRLAQAEGQIPSPSSTPDRPSSVSAGTDENKPVTEVLVTGSRIARGNEASATPLQALGTEELRSSGSVSPGDVIRQLPAIAAGVNSESSGASFNAAGLDLVDLRSLGTNRTLTLINGRRQVSSDPGSAAVDLNTIPTPLIERVEVITGGASAVYGADAVSGVVNIILKRNFEGLQIDSQYGISSRSDAKRQEVSVLAGTNFSENRGNVTGFLGYTSEGGVSWDARPGGVSGVDWLPNQANTGPHDGIPDFILANNVRQLGGQRESMFLLNRGNGQEAFAFNANGSVRPFALGPSGLMGGGQYTDGGEATLGFDSTCPQNQCPLKIPVKRYLGTLNITYGLTDSTDLFFEGRFATTKSESLIGSVFEIPPVTNSISIDNPFVSPSLRALMQQANVTSIGVIRSDQELGPRGQDAKRETMEFVGGARGNVGLGDFKYEVSMQYGNTDFTNTRLNDIYQDRWLDAIDVFRDSDGVIKCRSVVAQAQGCVPINLLQTGAVLTPEALKYVEIPTATETARIDQTVFSGHVTGSIGDFFGAGQTSLVVGAEYRKEFSDYETSPIDQQGEGFYYTQRLPTRGEYHVTEGFSEVLVPILRDRRFTKRLELEAAVRHSDYSTAGQTTSWKLGGNWAPVNDVRFRGTVARAVRAPNIAELFAVSQQGFVTADDPCDVANITGGAPNRAANCAALGVPANFISNARTINIRTATGGNPNLTVETANTWTVGTVFTPSTLPGFSTSVDYFMIKIENAVSVFSTQDILNACVDGATINNPFCASITRDTSGNLINVASNNINVSRLDREGVDFDVRYARQLGPGLLNLDFAGTRMLTNDTIVAPGTATFGRIDQNGEIGFPKWKGRLGAGYDVEPAHVSATLTWLSNMIRDNQPSSPEDDRAHAGTGKYLILNLQGGYYVTSKTRIYLGIDNVFDKLPPPLPDTRIGGAGSFPNAGIFSNIGRFFYGGVTLGL